MCKKIKFKEYGLFTFSECCGLLMEYDYTVNEIILDCKISLDGFKKWIYKTRPYPKKIFIIKAKKDRDNYKQNDDFKIIHIDQFIKEINSKIF